MHPASAPAVRRVFGALVLLSLLAAALLAAVPAQAQPAYAVVVTPTANVPESGVLQITLTGVPEDKGVYVYFCAEPPAGQRPAEGDCDEDQVWAVESYPYGVPPADGSVRKPSAGAFPLSVHATFGDVDCRATTCGVFVRRDHRDMSDTSLDRFMPVTFAAPDPDPEPEPEPTPTTNPPAYGVTVQPTTNLPTTGSVSVTITGLPEDEGVYVRLCAKPAAGQRPKDSDCDGQGVWALDRYPYGPPPTDGTVRKPSDGPFPLSIRATFGSVDCRTTECGVFVRRDHRAGADTSRDRFIPVTFARGAGVAAQRVSGSNRFATAAAASADSFAPGVPVVYVATGEGFADALAAGAAGGAQGGPVLLTARDLLPEPTKAELERLRPAKIVAVGGTAAISDRVLAELKRFGPVSRASGSDRFATAAAIARATFAPGIPTAYVATGGDYPDALAGAAIAGMHGGPVLLSATDRVPDVTLAELRRLQPRRIVILGGTAALSPAVATALAKIAPVNRISGANRFATAARISEEYSTAVTVYVATGGNYPDALAASAIAGRDGGPVLLVTRDSVPAETLAALRHLSPQRIVVLGGTGAVSDAVLNRLRSFES